MDKKDGYYMPPDAQKVFQYLFYKISTKHGKPMTFVYDNDRWIRSSVPVSDVVKMRDVFKKDEFERVSKEVSKKTSRKVSKKVSKKVGKHGRIRRKRLLRKKTNEDTMVIQQP